MADLGQAGRRGQRSRGPNGGAVEQLQCPRRVVDGEIASGNARMLVDEAGGVAALVPPPPQPPSDLDGGVMPADRLGVVDDLHPGLHEPEDEVAVLEPVAGERLVEPADGPEELGRPAQVRHTDRELAQMLDPAGTGPTGMQSGPPLPGLLVQDDFGREGAGTEQRSKPQGLMGGPVPTERPRFWHEVVVEEPGDLAGGRLETAVAGRRRPGVGLIYDLHGQRWPHGLQGLGGAVARTVDDDHQLHAGPSVLVPLGLEGRLADQPRQVVPPLVGRNGDGERPHWSTPARGRAGAELASGRRTRDNPARRYRSTRTGTAATVAARLWASGLPAGWRPSCSSTTSPSPGDTDARICSVVVPSRQSSVSRDQSHGRSPDARMAGAWARSIRPVGGRKRRTSTPATDSTIQRPRR